MKSDSFILKGDICYSSSPQSLQTRERYKQPLAPLTFKKRSIIPTGRRKGTDTFQAQPLHVLTGLSCVFLT